MPFGFYGSTQSVKECEGLSGDIGLIFQRARYNGNNNDKNIVRLIFYRHTFRLAAITIYARVLVQL